MTNMKDDMEYHIEDLKWTIVSCIPVYTGYIIHRNPILFRHIMRIKLMDECIFMDNCLDIMKEVVSRVNSDNLTELSIKIYGKNIMEHLQYLCVLSNMYLYKIINIIINTNNTSYGNLLLYLKLIKDEKWKNDYENILNTRRGSSSLINIPCNHIVDIKQKICDICDTEISDYIIPYTITIYTNNDYSNYIFEIYDKFTEYLKTI